MSVMVIMWPIMSTTELINIEVFKLVPFITDLDLYCTHPYYLL